MTRVMSRGKQIHADPLVLSTAQGIAQEMFERFLLDTRGNQLLANLRAANPGKDSVEIRELFVRRMTPNLLKEARATLARLLGTTTKKDLQEKISEALLRDNTLRRGRVRL